MSKSSRRERNDDRTSRDKPLSGSSRTADEKLVPDGETHRVESFCGTSAGYSDCSLTLRVKTGLSWQNCSWRLR